MSRASGAAVRRAPWGRYNYAFIAEISFCFSDAILVSRTDDEREKEGREQPESRRGEEGRACPPDWARKKVSGMQCCQATERSMMSTSNLSGGQNFKNSLVNLAKMYC